MTSPPGNAAELFDPGEPEGIPPVLAGEARRPGINPGGSSSGETRPR